MVESRKAPTRNDERVNLHFDYDCFYAAVFEAANPSLRALPLAVQQKQIIVTCNYAARRRGLHKLQLIRDARRLCPDLVVELGEDISRFRDASKALYAFLATFAWPGQGVERLGFDEVWLDVTDCVAWNVEVLNRGDLARAFFQLDRGDPTRGFEFDASRFAGEVVPRDVEQEGNVDGELLLRLRLGSHLAMYIRHQLEEHKGYTSTVGIATNKLLSKLVGNVHKPKGQTTLVPTNKGENESVLAFLDDHEIGRIPGIGFKLAQKLREFVLRRPAEFDAGLVYGGTKENVTVAALRAHPEVNPEMLERLLAGPGSPHGIGHKVWCLLHGVDDSEVSQARAVPRQISIEDSYIRLDTLPEVVKELTALAQSLITRMRIDLLGDDNEEDDFHESKDVLPTTIATNGADLASKKWLAHPKTLRLTTRPRQPLQPDGTRVRSFKRISHSAPLPTFLFNLNDPIPAQAERLVREALIPMFRKLHPERAAWNLSLVNLAVTNMAEAAGGSRTAEGRDIGGMFRRQEGVLREFRVVDDDDRGERGDGKRGSAEAEEKSGMDPLGNFEDGGETGWIEEDAVEGEMVVCPLCGTPVPAFAMGAHQRFHAPEGELTL